MWDEASGYYYDAASGFYYDGNTGLSLHSLISFQRFLLLFLFVYVWKDPVTHAGLGHLLCELCVYVCGFDQR